MSKQAEAERERRARVIAADGEYQAAQRLTDAAATMADTPGALQLRLLQTVVDVSAERNSTLVMPFPVEMLRFFEHHSHDSGDQDTERPESAGRTLPETIAAAANVAANAVVNGDDRTARQR
jgi:hypothetical protein